MLSSIEQFAKFQGIALEPKQMQRIFRDVRKQLNIQIEDGVIIRNEEVTWHDWLPEMEGMPTPQTDAYFRYLFNDQKSQYSDLDKDTNDILNLLSDPRKESAPISRKGLLLGDVQSGKTRTYTALMNKTIDLGYKLIIVLTSDNEKLRKQTQDRIDTDCIGAQQGVPTGIGKYLGGAIRPHCLTNIDEDFVSPSQHAFSNIQRPNWKGVPFIAVMKKNSSVLRKFIEWLDNDDLARDIPVLVIDDESDYASVNSSKIGEDPTTINSLLRKLCSISKRTSYVAVTATPFANIFIDDEESEDLFPEDFIYVLRTPAEYIGVLKIFGNRNEEDVSENDSPEGLPSSTPVRLLDQSKLEQWLPLVHKKNFQIDACHSDAPTIPHTTEDDDSSDLLDPQVRHAINCFLIACVLRPDSANKRQSMLIHMSRFQDVQQQIADRVYAYVGSLNNALRFHSHSDDPRIQSLHSSFESEYRNYAAAHDQTWDTVLQNLERLMRSNRVVVRLENSTSDDWNKLHNADEETAPNECTIYIGGNQLSRGMTLDGLICSVFYRQVSAADTLLQMGRWFGYRPDYVELQRVWLLPQTIADFKYAGSIIEDIKQTARSMKAHHSTPKQFGISIRKNPNNGVRITNPTKMRNAEEGIDSEFEFDLENNIIESVRLSTSSERSHTNDNALKTLVKVLCTDTDIARSTDPKGDTVVFEGVPSHAVTSFLKSYRSGYNDVYFGPTLLRYRDKEPVELSTTMAEQFAITQEREHPDITWDVAFINGKGDVIDEPFHWRGIQRAYKEDSGTKTYQVSGNKLRLGSKSDIVKVAQAVTGEPIKREIRNERDFYDTKLFGNHPVLMLYRVTLTNKAEHKTAPMANPHGLLAAKIVVPSDTPGSATGKGKAKYYLNTVASRQQYEKLREEDAAGED